MIFQLNGTVDEKYYDYTDEVEENIFQTQYKEKGENETWTEVI